MSTLSGWKMGRFGAHTVPSSGYAPWAKKSYIASLTQSDGSEMLTCCAMH